ncbi:MAG TPA: class I tRNA ligase family protein, partial [Dehalococcoidia bacterium]|nr:class I tRNA ligase family protein [Dehalococcoidia bacterium]
PTACEHCGSAAIHQDPDVLDTWFSSGLWPHSTLGWPDQSEDLRYFYPTSVMETGYDILFFWVARMIMLGLANTGEIPFRWVYLHGLVRDEKGEKMSKSKGNVVNPITVMDEYGTDALRITLSTGGTPGNDLKLSPARLAAGRNFATKIWNATRFVLTETDAGHEPVAYERLAALRQDPATSAQLSLADRWIISRFFQVVEQVDRLLCEFQLGEAGRQINDFFWGEFCDWYIEIAKRELRRAEREGRPSPAPAVLRGVLEGSLRLLHPFMPFVTEELWQHLTGGRIPDGGRAVRTDGPVSLMVMAYPEPRPDLIDPEAERQLDLFTSLVREVRSLRAEYNVPSGHWVEATVVAGPSGIRSALEAQAEALTELARVRPLAIVESLPARPAQALTVLVDGVEAYLPLAGLFDVKAEIARLDAELRAAQSEVDRLEAKLANPSFIERAPPAVVEKEREKLRAAQERIAKLERRRNELL